MLIYGRHPVREALLRGTSLSEFGSKTTWRTARGKTSNAWPAPAAFPFSMSRGRSSTSSFAERLPISRGSGTKASRRASSCTKDRPLPSSSLGSPARGRRKGRRPPSSRPRPLGRSAKRRCGHPYRGSRRGGRGASARASKRRGYPCRGQSLCRRGAHSPLREFPTLFGP